MRGNLKFTVAAVAGLICFVFLATFDQAMAQDEKLQLSKVIKRPTDPFKANEHNAVRGMWTNFFASKHLPQWRNEAEFKRAKLPAAVEDDRREAWQREALEMAAEAGFGVRRMLYQLQIKLKDGRFVYFADKFHGSDGFREAEVVFEYKGFDKRRRFYFVEDVVNEGGGMSVISADSGMIWHFEGNPSWSPDRNRIAGFFDYAGSNTELTVLHLGVGRATYEVQEYESILTRVFNNSGIDGLHWEGNDTLHLRNASDTYMLMRRTAAGWRVKRLKEPIPKTMIIKWHSDYLNRYGTPDDRPFSFPYNPDRRDRLHMTSDPVHGHVNPDWLCLFEDRLC